MISQADNLLASVRAKAEVIVAKGNDVRKQVADLVTCGAGHLQSNAQGLIALSHSVMDGATAALEKAVPHDSECVLRQVIDGLGDGLSTAALATRLAVEEAKAQKTKFAEEDLSTMSADLRKVGEMFVDTVWGTLKNFKSITAAELSALRSHAERTMERLLPSINSALGRIAEHPIQFGKESIEAGVKLSRLALGSLCAAVGRRMDEAGKRLTGESSAE